MKQVLVVAAIVVVLIIGGGLTNELISGNAISSLFIQQSGMPEASTLTMVPWQAEQLVMFVGFILFNLVGIGATIAIVMWFLHRGAAKAKAQSVAEEA